MLSLGCLHLVYELCTCLVITPCFPTSSTWQPLFYISVNSTIVDSTSVVLCSICPTVSCLFNSKLIHVTEKKNVFNMGYLICPEKLTEKKNFNLSFSTEKASFKNQSTVKIWLYFKSPYSAPLIYSWFLLFMEVVFYKVTMTTELMNTEQLLLGEIKG